MAHKNFYNLLMPGFAAPTLNRLEEVASREKRRLAGIRRRKKVTGKDVGYFGQGLGAHRKPVERYGPRPRTRYRNS
jgi:hypothetical protein